MKKKKKDPTIPIVAAVIAVLIAVICVILLAGRPSSGTSAGTDAVNSQQTASVSETEGSDDPDRESSSAEEIPDEVSETESSDSEESENETTGENSSPEESSAEESFDSSEESLNEDPEENSEEEEEFLGSTFLDQTPFLIRVNMTSNVITIYTYDEDGGYTVPVKAMICSTGPNSPLGSYTMGYQARWNGLILDEWGQYVSHITGDYLFHTVPSATQSASTVIVSEYNQLGTTCSHGCIRITAGDAYWMYTNCTEYETLIEIGYYNSDPLGKPASIQLPTDTEYNWDPTDPDPENPWNDCSPHFEGVPETLILAIDHSLPDLRSGVTAYDTCGNVMSSFYVEPDVNVHEAGEYEIVYSCKDALGRTAEAVTKVTIVDPEAVSKGTSD